MGDVNSQVTCIENAQKNQQNIAEIQQQQQQAQQSQQSSSSVSSTKRIFGILALVAAVLFLIVLIVIAIMYAVSGDDNEETQVPLAESQMFSDYPPPYQIEQPQQIYSQTTQ